MMELKRYQKSNKKEWDNFIDKSRFDTFLFKRDFMDYHADRFNDCSFMFYRKGKLAAILPGNVANKTWYSHQGLTYGGLITSNKISINDVLEIFENLNNELRANNIEEVIYKPTPHIYHIYPSEEDLYALFTLKAEKIACNLSTTILLENRIPFIESRKSGIRKALREGLSVIEHRDFSSFWSLLEENLEKTHGVKPVHSLQEIHKLKDAFPNNIRLFCTVSKGSVIGGSLLFIMRNRVHVQYISSNETGKELGALDLLFHELINGHFTHFQSFDFGHSTEKNGYLLNNGLIFQKEGFGGRGVVYEIFKYIL